MLTPNGFVLELSILNVQDTLKPHNSLVLAGIKALFRLLVLGCKGLHSATKCLGM